MDDARFNILISAKAQLDDLLKLQHELVHTQEAHHGLLESFRHVAEIAVLGVSIAALTEKILEIPEAFKEAVKEGIEFNREIQDAQYGVAGIYRQFDYLGRYKDFDAALQSSANAMAMLKSRATEAAIPFRSLIETFKETSGAAASAGLDARQTIDLIMMGTQAAKGVGVPNGLVSMELREIMEGRVNTRSPLAAPLGITAAEINRAKEQGRLMEYLTEKMGKLAEVGRNSGDTFSYSLTRLQENYEILLARITEPVNDVLIKFFKELTVVISDPNFGQAFIGIMGEVREVIESVLSGLVLLIKHTGEVTMAFQILSSVLVGGALFKAASFIIPLVVSFGAWVASIGGAVTELGALGAVWETVFGGLAALLAAPEIILAGMIALLGAGAAWFWQWNNGQKANTAEAGRMAKAYQQMNSGFDEQYAGITSVSEVQKFVLGLDKEIADLREKQVRATREQHAVMEKEITALQEKKDLAQKISADDLKNRAEKKALDDQLLARRKAGEEIMSELTDEESGGKKKRGIGLTLEGLRRESRQNNPDELYREDAARNEALQKQAGSLEEVDRQIVALARNLEELRKSPEENALELTKIYSETERLTLLRTRLVDSNKELKQSEAELRSLELERLEAQLATAKLQENTGEIIRLTREIDLRKEINLQAGKLQRGGVPPDQVNAKAEEQAQMAMANKVQEKKRENELKDLERARAANKAQYDDKLETLNQYYFNDFALLQQKQDLENKKPASLEEQGDLNRKHDSELNEQRRAIANAVLVEKNKNEAKNIELEKKTSEDAWSARTITMTEYYEAQQKLQKRQLENELVLHKTEEERAQALRQYDLDSAELQRRKVFAILDEYRAVQDAQREELNKNMERQKSRSELNPDLTPGQKNLESRRIFTEQGKSTDSEVLDKKDRLDQDVRLGKISPAEEIRQQGEINDLLLRRAEINKKIEDTTPTVQFEAPLKKAYEDSVISAQKLGQTVASIAGSMSSSWTSGMMAIIDGSKSVGQAFQDMAAQIVNSIIQMVVQMVAQAVIMAAIIATLNSIAPGAGSLLVAGAGTAGAAKQGAGFLGLLTGGFAEGGYTGDGQAHEPAGIVHRGEFVLSKQQTAKLGLNYLTHLADSAQRGYAGGGLVTGGLRRLPAEALPEPQPNRPVIQNHVETVVLDGTRQSMNRYAESRAGREAQSRNEKRLSV